MHLPTALPARRRAGPANRYAALVAAALVLFGAGAAYAKTYLDCPEHTRLELKPLHKGVEAYCVLGDGKRHGPWGGWYANGQRATAGFYDNGRLHGVETEWYDASELSGWRRFQARFRKPRRSRTDWSRGKRHGESIEWDVRGRVLQRSTWHRGEFEGYERPSGSAAADAELGRPFTEAPKPKGCFERRFYPRLLRDLLGEPAEGYSGFEVQYGTSKNCALERLPCRNFSHAQLSDIMGHEIQGFADSARFAVASCRTDEDQRSHTAAEERKWRRRSAIDRDPGVVAFLDELSGVWCGRSTRTEQNHEWRREVRIEFIPGDPERAARATDTWNRVPEGPMGEPGYVMSSLLIPMPRSGVDPSPADGGREVPAASRMHFKPVSVHPNAGGFVLSRGEQGLVLQHSGRTFPMSPDCAGFWEPSGPDPGG
jgi:hypothetical protein